MEYFYTLPELVLPPSLVIEGDEFVHLTHVMRKQAGDAISVVDGRGNVYETVLEKIVQRSAVCRITRQSVAANEPAVQLTLGVALLKSGSRFDLLVEKAVELGVHTLVPVLTERTIPRKTKVDRWQKIALAAMKQSGRAVLPAVKPLIMFQEFLLDAGGSEGRFIPHEKISRPLLRETCTEEQSRVTVCVGPEGGFSDEEIRLAVNAGFTPVSLGPRRLRAETAAIVAAATILI